MTKYSNAVKYSEFAEMAFERMGDIRFRIYYIMSSDRYFFLPDVSSISTKARINNYFNSDNNEIAIVGTPLTSKIFLHSQSAKLGNLSNSIHKIQDDVFPSEIERINYGLYTGSYKEIACESQEYLEKFRDNLDLIKNYVFSK